MSNIFEITNDYETVLNMLYDENVDEQMILDTLESIDSEFDDKADGYAKIIKKLEYKKNAKREEGMRLIQESKVLDKRINVLKQNLFNSMKRIGKTKFTTNLFSFNITKNGGQQKITIDGEVPEEYTKTIIENDTDKIRQALEEGQILPFARLEPRGESLRIK